MAETSWPWAAILLVAVLPVVLTAATAFAKSSVLLGAVRIGLGAEALLGVPVIFALSVVLTAVVMAPVAGDVLGEVERTGGIDGLASAPVSAWWDAAEPWRAFLARHADANELEMFAELQGRPQSDPLVVVPAFLITELREALAMAVVILVPLVVVDLLVAQATTLLGMTNLQVQVVSVPLKLLLFLAIDGWNVVVGGLLAGYR
jgi:flagellar biosynthesis protein FliP